MQQVFIKELTLDDTDDLFKFETDNKDYFNSIGLGRDEKYYEYNFFKAIINNLVSEQNQDMLYMYLIYNRNREIVGRVNLTEIIREPLHKAEIGYRIGEMYQKKGYATEAVNLVLEKALNNHNLHRIEAGTSPDNKCSQNVLLKTGFTYVGRYSQYIKINGNWTDSLIYEKVLD